ncbi:hypothetical protein T310_9787, partial [Rasamsonia emersonii CBS 393.64]
LSSSIHVLWRHPSCYSILGSSSGQTCRRLQLPAHSFLFLVLTFHGTSLLIIHLPLHGPSPLSRTYVVTGISTIISSIIDTAVLKDALIYGTHIIHYGSSIKVASESESRACSCPPESGSSSSSSPVPRWLNLSLPALPRPFFLRFERVTHRRLQESWP